ncbi:MAG: DMT family transporter [Bacteriovoracaceae bacterium]|jgi:drug/metabolite transporter (DMT)-like permease|nr:DMT family transporter [Bacteriovoracaceae bacterium]
MVIFSLILVQVLFGINFSTNKVMVQTFDPLVWSNIRFFIAAIVMGGLSVFLKREKPPLNKQFILPCIAFSFLAMSIGQVLFLYGLKYTSSINTAILTSTIPLLTIFVVVLRKEEKASFRKVLGLLLGFAGVLVIKDLSKVSFSSNSFIGDLLVFISALSFALYLSFAKKFLKSYDSMWITSWMLFFSSIFLTIINFNKWMAFELPLIDYKIIFSGSYTIIGATVITYFLSNWALKKASSSNVALFIYLQPVVAGIIGFLFLGESITTRMFISFILIFSGLAINIFGVKKV